MPTTGFASAFPSNNLIAFDVTRGEGPLGQHRVKFSQDGARLTVDVEIDFQVRVAFVTAFRYNHRNREVWEDGRLVEMDSETNDNGDEYTVAVRPDGDDLLVNSSAHGEQLMPADAIPSSYWNQATVDQTRLIDTGQGRILDITVEDLGDSITQLHGETFFAKKYRTFGTIPVDVWYSPRGQWVKLRFEARGATVNYTLTEDSGLLL